MILICDMKIYWNYFLELNNLEVLVLIVMMWFIYYNFFIWKVILKVNLWIGFFVEGVMVFFKIGII